jgi:hypothetical protein
MHFSLSLLPTLLVLPFATLATVPTEQMVLTPPSAQEQPLTHTQPTLADLLTINPSLSIFYSYARELELSLRFADGDARTTVLAPTNHAVMTLARKPYATDPPI